MIRERPQRDRPVWSWGCWSRDWSFSSWPSPPVNWTQPWKTWKHETWGLAVYKTDHRINLITHFLPFKKDAFLCEAASLLSLFLVSYPSLPGFTHCLTLFPLCFYTHFDEVRDRLRRASAQFDGKHRNIQRPCEYETHHMKGWELSGVKESGEETEGGGE